MNDINERYLTIKSPVDIVKMRAAGKLAARALQHTLAAVAAGVTTDELDTIAHDFIMANGGFPASLGYRGFPKSICTSVNQVVCHGIPSKQRLKEGDIINLDIAVVLDGWHGDNSVTVPVGVCGDSKHRLMRVTKEALDLAIAHVRPGVRTRELGGIIERHVTKHGFTTVREFVGHGIGRGYHEPPEILHYENIEFAVRLRPGMTFTIEPMVCAGRADVFLDQVDGWTVRTRDGLPSAQFESTILVTEYGSEILTKVD